VTDSRPSPSRVARLIGFGTVAAIALALGRPGLPGTSSVADRLVPGLEAAEYQSSSGQSGGRGPGFQGWWSDPAIKTEIKLTEDQSRRIKEIFERRETEIKPLLAQLNRESDRLDRMTKERVADEITYAVQVAKVESLAARWRESRTMMIYRMYRELQPEQYTKLQEIMDRRRAMNGRGSGSR
jgi:Spy/CpxP family protein refolding chaperone